MPGKDILQLSGRYLNVDMVPPVMLDGTELIDGLQVGIANARINLLGIEDIREAKISVPSLNTWRNEPERVFWGRVRERLSHQGWLVQVGGKEHVDTESVFSVDLPAQALRRHGLIGGLETVMGFGVSWDREQVIYEAWRDRVGSDGKVLSKVVSKGLREGGDATKRMVLGEYLLVGEGKAIATEQPMLLEIQGGDDVNVLAALRRMLEDQGVEKAYIVARVEGVGNEVELAKKVAIGILHKVNERVENRTWVIQGSLDKAGLGTVGLMQPDQGDGGRLEQIVGVRLGEGARMVIAVKPLATDYVVDKDPHKVRESQTASLREAQVKYERDVQRLLDAENLTRAGYMLEALLGGTSQYQGLIDYINGHKADLVEALVGLQFSAEEAHRHMAEAITTLLQPTAEMGDRVNKGDEANYLLRCLHGGGIEVVYLLPELGTTVEKTNHVGTVLELAKVMLADYARVFGKWGSYHSSDWRDPYHQRLLNLAIPLVADGDQVIRRGRLPGFALDLPRDVVAEGEVNFFGKLVRYKTWKVNGMGLTTNEAQAGWLEHTDLGRAHVGVFRDDSGEIDDMRVEFSYQQGAKCVYFGAKSKRPGHPYDEVYFDFDDGWLTREIERRLGVVVQGSFSFKNRGDIPNFTQAMEQTMAQLYELVTKNGGLNVYEILFVFLGYYTGWQTAYDRRGTREGHTNVTQQTANQLVERLPYLVGSGEER